MRNPVRIVGITVGLVVVSLAVLIYMNQNRKAKDNALAGRVPQTRQVDGGTPIDAVESGDAANNQNDPEIDEALVRQINQISDEDDIITRIGKASAILAQIDDRSGDVIKYYFNLRLRMYSEQEIEQVLQNYSTFTAQEREIACYLLATNPLILGKPALSYQYFGSLQKQYPRSVFLRWMLRREEDLMLLKKAVTGCREIENMALETDERLWRTGSLFEEVLLVSWNEGEGSFADLSYPYSLYEKLIKDYPDSTWADNAEWAMRCAAEQVIHEDGATDVGCIEELEKFILKYPDSDCIPAVKLQIAGHYFEDAINWEDPVVQINEDYLKKAEDLYREVTQTYKNTKYEGIARDELETIKSIKEERAQNTP